MSEYLNPQTYIILKNLEKSFGVSKFHQIKKKDGSVVNGTLEKISTGLLYFDINGGNHLEAITSITIKTKIEEEIINIPSDTIESFNTEIEFL